MNAHSHSPHGVRLSDCHRCHGTGMVTRGVIGKRISSEPCRGCAPFGQDGNWSEKQQRYASPETAHMERHNAKHGSADDILFGSPAAAFLEAAE